MTKKQIRKKRYLSNKLAKKIVQLQSVDEVLRAVLKDREERDYQEWLKDYRQPEIDPNHPVRIVHPRLAYLRDTARKEAMEKLASREPFYMYGDPDTGDKCVVTAVCAPTLVEEKECPPTN